MENVFFESPDVKVTNSRFVVKGETYALTNITSVKAEKVGGSGEAVFVLSLVAGVVAAGFWGWQVGLLVCGIGVAVSFNINKPVYTVVVKTAGGDLKAYESGDAAMVNNIVAALNDAIVERG